MLEGLHLIGGAGPSVLSDPKGEKLGLMSGNDREKDLNSKLALPSLSALSHATLRWSAMLDPSFQFLAPPESFAAASLLASPLKSWLNCHFLRESFSDQPLLFSIMLTPF